ncbi:MAG TPA: hypothetical protein VEF34_17865 [Syntrophobacteraceae bacterium]|nr:hypothetical protein [Syntrophobacteraceae bacterium]
MGEADRTVMLMDHFEDKNIKGLPPMLKAEIDRAIDASNKNGL